MSTERNLDSNKLDPLYWFNRKFKVLFETNSWISPYKDSNKRFVPNDEYKEKLEEGIWIEFINKKKMARIKRGPVGNQHIVGWLIPMKINGEVSETIRYVSEKDLKKGRFRGEYTLKERRARNKYIYDILQEPSLDDKRAKKQYGHSFHGIFAIKEATAYQPSLYSNNKNLKYPVDNKFSKLLANDSKEWKSAFSKLLKRYFKLDKNKIAIDLGCGGNQFLNKLRENGMTGIGVDISNSAADIIAPIHDTGINGCTADLITAFDVMEHLEPDGIEESLIEMKRIAKPDCAFIFTIATWSAIRKVKTEDSHDVYELHPTQKSEDWWKGKLNKHDFKIDRLEQVIAQSGETEAGNKIEIRVWGKIKNHNTI